jgi:Flp pilus assembly protein TadG
VLMVPLVLIALLFVVQFALAYYARTVVSGAAQDGAAAAARRNASTADGIALADSLVEQGAGSLLDSHSATASATDNVVTVRVEGEVVSLLPFFGTITVAASSSARIEEFSPQGESP